MPQGQPKNIFVIGLDDANLPTLQAVPQADSYRFHRLLSIEELQEGEVSVPDLLNRARAVLDAHDGSVDAIVGYWDFPVSILVPLLGKEYGVRTTGLESVVKCEHKYWSRLEQQKVIDEYPRFGRVDLDTDDPQPPEGVNFPMWLKPALAYSSELAFGVSDMKEFREAVAAIREGIARVGRPFDTVLDLLDLPPEMEGVGGQVCLAEEAMTGIQVAVEGYVYEGEVTVYGVLDSINYPNSSCFLRHQYPSTLPAPVIRKLHDVSERTMRQIGMESATFSIEYFYDPKTGDISLLEINPRHSQSHAELFDYVDGAPNHHRMLSLSQGVDPALPGGQGPYKTAAKWYYRWFGDGTVHEVPSAERIAEIEREIPGVRVDVVPEEGQKLSTVSQQDSYSYEVAHIFTGGDDEDDLRRKFDRCVAALGLTFDHTEPGGRGKNPR
ncbi:MULTISPECIES: ATP-grasp domain-containing protein [unclassified Streptomyces]|uniref:ATP-grasp domain-containing protein n=1 Tax=Streptomyces TaxID=1883 RepID=UPI0001C1A276|nr:MULTISPECIES: ATP-grasp domain-containing protein [unclassified Streptomyces]MYR67940.1 ATP-grasp domain-containing protein [Streptomyces sp. SID4939]MYS01592.1 ATP-grasp domain-containing protein [Streptomyces sp. SID4940]MYT67717.1 ATP-grasp domain-containing protein [Streptomyces sp. SID8357]MYT86561.1 ATP-grasp domain-containing protein [Streptomyces sp. SID8360]MYU35642.1 ATP-grasp domain-containing protein [Streptomyces sp. SID8358]MYW41277.1 ATP-grasp domain-containing protein [Stre